MASYQDIADLIRDMINEPDTSGGKRPADRTFIGGSDEHAAERVVVAEFRYQMMLARGYRCIDAHCWRTLESSYRALDVDFGCAATVDAGNGTRSVKIHTKAIVTTNGNRWKMQLESNEGGPAGVFEGDIARINDGVEWTYEKTSQPGEAGFGKPYG